VVWLRRNKQAISVSYAGKGILNASPSGDPICSIGARQNRSTAKSEGRTTTFKKGGSDRHELPLAECNCAKPIRRGKGLTVPIDSVGRAVDP
jgi:hypothetical protein